MRFGRKTVLDTDPPKKIKGRKDLITVTVNIVQSVVEQKPQPRLAQKALTMS